MSELEDSDRSSDGSADMDIEVSSDTSSIELGADDVEEMIANQPIVPLPALRSSARLSMQRLLRRAGAQIAAGEAAANLARATAREAAAANLSRASAQSTSRPPVSPTRSPIRSPGQRAPEMNFSTDSSDSVDSTDSVIINIDDSSPFQINSYRRRETPPVRFFPIPRPSNQPPIRRVVPIDNALQPSTSKEPSENIMNDSCNRDASSCPICLDDLNNAGPHKPACLKCGHIFGESCIQRWIKVGCSSDARRCPTCNTKASLKDIRVLYTNKLIAVDTAELTNVKNTLKQEQILNGAIKTELNNCREKNCNLREEVKRLKVVVDKLTAGVPPTNVGPTSGRLCLKKIKIYGKNPDCRVIAFNRNNMLLVVSQVGEGPFGNSHGIRKLNALILEPTKEFIFIHKKQIRDMSFHPIDYNQLATVSLDKCVCLTDVSSNSVISNVGVGEPLWCCCWAGNNNNILIAGGQMGSLYFFDRRYMKLIEQLNNRNPACVSLSPIPSATSRSFPNGGFLKTRMDCLSIFEQGVTQSGLNYKEHNLPLKGKWSSSTYDIQSNLLLTSAKPCGANQSIRHVVSKISDLNEEGPTIQPVVTFYGGDKATQLTRSCFVPSEDNFEDVLVCGFDEKSKAIKIFDVSKNTNVHNFSVNEMITDLCPLNGVSTNGRRTIAALSNSTVNIFCV